MAGRPDSRVGASRSAGARSVSGRSTYPDQNRVELFVEPTTPWTGCVGSWPTNWATWPISSSTTTPTASVAREARGVGSAVPWWPTGSTYDFDTLAGDFAEGFATWLVGSASESRVVVRSVPITSPSMRELAG